MRSRSFAAVLLAMLVLLVLAGAVLAYDSSHSDQLANGVKIAGIDVGGMSVTAAEAKLRASLQARLARPIVLRYRTRRFILTPREAHLAFDPRASVQQALARTRSANLLTRVWRSLTGGSVGVQLPPRISFSRRALASFLDRVAAGIDTPARDATISYSGTSISPVPSRQGVSVRKIVLLAAVQRDLEQGLIRRRISIPVALTQPRVATDQLPARYPAIVTIDRASFKLRLWKHLRLAKTYTIAVGQAGLETPAGLHHVIDKEVDPPWHVPNSAWAGSLAGQTIPYGPQDPLKARWIGFYDGDGIHGTDDIASLGSAASHGCIRMSIPDVIELYPQVPMGAPVYVA